MKKPSEPDETWDTLREKIIGLGEGSIRKSYYPELQQRLAELERFRALLDQSNDAIFLMELPAGRIVDVNESACQQLGYTREELLNQPIDQPGSTALTAWLNTQPRTEPNMFEASLRRVNGLTVPVEITARRVVFEGTDYTVVAARNITERKQAGQQLALVNFALNHVHEAAFLTDEDARFLYVNVEACRVLGYSQAELLDRTVANIDPDFPLERWPAHWREIKAHGSLTFEGRHQTKDGRIFPVEVTANYFEYDGRGYNLALVRDIAERKRAEAERLVHLQYFESMDQVNRAMQRSTDLEKMLSGVLAVVLSIFDCDRAWLLYPCDPAAPSFRVPMEITKPEYPGAKILNVDIPMSPGEAENMREALASDVPVVYVEGTDRPVMTAKQFGVRSQMFMPIYPKLGKPWVFGLHQCSHPRLWTPDEQNLFQEIGWRLGDSLTSLLAFRDLRESEARFSTAFHHSPIAISIMRAADNRFVDVNDVFVATTGYARTEIIGRTSSELGLWATPAAQERRLQQLQQFQRRDLTDSFEFHLRTKSGEIRIGLAATAVIDLSGEKHYLSLSYDITDRKRAEEALRLREAHAQSLLRLSKNLERAQTYGEVLTAAAAEAKTIVGYQNLWVYLLAEDKQHFIALTAIGEQSDAVMTGQGIATLTIQGDPMLEEIAQAKDIIIVEDARLDLRTDKAIVARLGNRTIVNVPIILFDKHLGTVGMGTFGDEGVRPPTRSEQEFLLAMASHIAVALDRIHLLIERRRAELEIIRLNRLYAVLSDINQAIVRTRDRQVLFEQTCRIAVEVGQFKLVSIGYIDQSTQLLNDLAHYSRNGEPFTSATMPVAEHLARLRDPKAAAILEGKPYVSNDVKHDEPPAAWRETDTQAGHRSLAVLPLMVFDQVWGAIHFYSPERAFFDEREIHLLKELAADLAYAVESLQRDEQRRQAEEAMRQAQKMESIGVLAGGVAHDFNNLLVAILGQASLALQQLPPENLARSHVEKAVGAAQRAADLTRQLLAYSGRGQFQILPLNLNKLIQENLHLFEVAIPKNVRLVSQLLPSLPFVDGDVGQMQQVVMNLIINAAEAIERNPGTVTVTTHIYQVTSADIDLWKYSGSALTPGRYVALSVQDNGSGMDAVTLSKVFDPFFTTKVTGRGLGLAAVQGIVRSHRGGLQVKSQPGQGTTFTLYFPVSATQPAAPGVAHDQHPAPAFGLILVIDDEEPVREAVTDILEAEGLTVITAADGETGLDVYREHQADIRLVVLDLSMPGLSGEATLQELREINPGVAVLVSSGYHPSEVARRFSNYGSVGFLQKPYDMMTLVREVQRHLAP